MINDIWVSSLYILKNTVTRAQTYNASLKLRSTLVQIRKISFKLVIKIVSHIL